MRGRRFEDDHKASKKKLSVQPKQKRIASFQRKALANNPHPSVAMVDPCVQGLNASSRFYLDYFNLRISKLFILCDSDNNPFRHLLTYATDDIPLQKCIIAVSARHFANTGQSFDQTSASMAPRFVVANLDALHFKRQTIQAVTGALNSHEMSRKNTLLASIFLLIFLDLLESGIDGWNHHICGARGLVSLGSSLLDPGHEQATKRQMKTNHGDMATDTRKFISRQLNLYCPSLISGMTQKIPVLTNSRISTLGDALSGCSKSGSEAFPNCDSEIKQESIVRSFLGCPDLLLRAIRYFSSQRAFLGNLDSQKTDSVNDHIRDTMVMLDMTGNFDCQQWASRVISLTVFDLKIEKLSLLAKAYKSAALIYGTRIFRAFASLSNTLISTQETENMALISELIATIELLAADEMFFKCLIWPTFIAGLECQTANTRDSITVLLRGLWNSTSCLNVINASRILQEYWQKQDSSDNLGKAHQEIEVMGQGWLLI
ncbi:unnamed protein product [Penicillium pancosmium]